MVPPQGLASLSAILSSAYAFSAVLGPILGGLIRDYTTWRWVVFMNVPPGVLVLVMLFVLMPAGFPHQSEKLEDRFTMGFLLNALFGGAIFITVVILGLGIGLTLSSLLIAAPTVIEEKDTVVFIGALTQARILGGSIGLAVCTNILKKKVKSASSFLSSQQMNDLLQSAQTIKTLPPSLQEAMRQVFGKGYNEEMQALTAFGGATVLATLMMWEKKPRRMQ
ncbi:hypothetical protein OEA41_008600 [Lepraria neglecta]|uniref:Major facilitator superfamily (MFS) profile domain-containing protein n=1 Tax=Lepraria neglecta TaxID=209136 RepID=A0AAD9Z2S0_9LECA|nr:hypothetical protein OEA41_008600 [Lepraria neglecta]